MLEALVDRTNGTVIVLAPAGKAWGEFERSYFKVCQWQDDAMATADDVIVEPYTAYDEATRIPLGQTKWVDVSSIDLAGGETLDWSIVGPAVRTT